MKLFLSDRFETTQRSPDIHVNAPNTDASPAPRVYDPTRHPIPMEPLITLAEHKQIITALQTPERAESAGKALSLALETINADRAFYRETADALAAWRELADYVRLGACASIYPGRYTDAATRAVAQALRNLARRASA